MKNVKVTLLGHEIKIHNKREQSLVNCTRNTATSVLEWMDIDSTHETIISCDFKTRRSIAEREAREVHHLFTAMYFMGMVKKPVYVDLDEILAWNGND